MFATGSLGVAQPLLDRAIEFAKETPWLSPGEERIGLLNLIVLAADHYDPSARGLMDAYERIDVKIDSSLSFLHDGRLRAMEDHARGALFAAEGAREQAEHLLTQAHAAFSSLEYTWRAACVALDLYKLTGDRVWLRKAEGATTEFPEMRLRVRFGVK